MTLTPEKNLTMDDLRKSYDEVPYPSHAKPFTHIKMLGAIAELYGLNPASPAACRVLELGCADGGNLVPMAFEFPSSRFVGIDLSAAQIHQGRSLVDELGLENIELRQGDILELGDELGTFDYIIAHGVYSWVPQPVREHLLALARRLLEPGGLFYVSFNTLPGWRMRGMLRDILRFACRGRDEVADKLDAAYAALSRLETALGDLQALSARYMREEIKHLRGAHPSYLLFEYLAEENHAFLFSEFLVDAGRHHLRYLCDTELSSLFPSTFGSATETALEAVEDDMELEQWLDFVSARNFRRCVLCRDDVEVADELSLDAFAEFSFGSDLSPPQRVDLRGHKPAAFGRPDGTRVQVKHPLTKALLLEMGDRQPDLLHLQELLAGAERRLVRGGGERHAREYDLCLMELFTLFANRALTASPNTERFSCAIEVRPAATRLARLQVARGSTHLATARHADLDLDSFSARMITHLDGDHDLEETSRLLVSELGDGTLEPPPGSGFDGWSPGKLQARFEQNCREMVRLFERQGVLSATAGE